MLDSDGDGTSISASDGGESSVLETGNTDESSTTTDADTNSVDESDTDETQGCPPGTLDCPCDIGEVCAPGLQCEAGLCEPMPVCGNGIVETGEQCDDGNVGGGDGCEADCSSTRIVQITAGGNHTCVLTDAGDVICWGHNNRGQLGYGHVQPVGDNEAPAVYGVLPLVQSATAIAAGAYHTCAVLASGTVTCWGQNTDGQLGLGHLQDIGDNEDIDTLIPLDFGDSIQSVTAGSSFTCALSVIGGVYCWGGNAYGQLGHGNLSPIGDNEIASNANSFVQVGGAVSSLRAGAHHVCASMVAGGLRCWGHGSSGRLGYGNTNNIGDDELPSAVSLKYGGEVIPVVAAGSSHTVALHPNSGSAQIRGWGSNSYGKLGVGSTVNHGDGVGPLEAIAGVSGTVVTVAASNNQTCALFDDGALGCWGANSAGQLGLGSTQHLGDDELPSSAAKLSFAAPVVQIAMGFDHTCVLLDDQDVHCWGSNAYGQLGLEGVDAIGDNELATDADPVPLFD
ncbi:RCC1 domain-containing protein [Enhygromyxa salina]|uniref:RCC1 domain-containing protein n=1 Tax=Enhygromyxa salina TaxID=215803 RepID=UPI0015E7A69F|nr:DUF4215 domain-containing protein [Enhygromyxa salina]